MAGRGTREAAAVLDLHAASMLFESGPVDRANELVAAARPLASRQPEAFAFDWLLAAGFLHQGQGDHGRAFALYAAALELRPADAAALLARATALEFFVLPDGFGALVVPDRDVWRLLDPGSFPPRELAYQLANPRSDAPYRGQLLERVARQYRDVLALDPGSIEARLRLGPVLEARGRRAEAEVELRAVAASREDPFAASIARLCLARLEPSPEGAGTAYRSALEIDPRLSPAWLGLSQSLDASGDRAGAFAALERVLSIGEARSLSAWVVCRRIVEATSDVACCYKPNAAFWEQYGPRGWEGLASVRQSMPTDIPVLLDCRRADIRETMAAYARAVFDAMGFEACTVHAYHGADSLEAFTRNATRGVYVVRHTSNTGRSRGLSGPAIPPPGDRSAGWRRRGRGPCRVPRRPGVLPGRDRRGILYADVPRKAAWPGATRCAA